MPPKADYRLIQIFVEFAKPLERLGWRNNDCEQFANNQLPLLKSLSKASCSFKKTELRVAVQAAKLSISAAEGELLVGKIKDTVMYVRRRLRDMGSGKFLPYPCQALLKIWSRQSSQKGSKKRPGKLRMRRRSTWRSPPPWERSLALARKRSPASLTWPQRILPQSWMSTLLLLMMMMMALVLHLHHLIQRLLSPLVLHLQPQPPRVSPLLRLLWALVLHLQPQPPS